MSESDLPEINLEIADGALKIRTPKIVYRITLEGEGYAPAPLPPAQPAPAALEAPADKADETGKLLAQATAQQAPLPADATDAEGYYRDLSHDMLREVGRLARRLSMSIRDVKIDKLPAVDLESAGEQLELAKDQLEDVVKMQESATNKIIDLGEDIQRAVDKSRNIMERMNQPAGQAEDQAPEDAEGGEGDPELKQAVQALSEYLAAQKSNPLTPLLERAESIASALEAGAMEPAASAPEPAPEAAYNFPLEMVFQTVYELCTNETVKKHIKAMWESGGKGFDQTSLQEALNALVKEEPDQDNFLNLDLKGVLQGLYKSSGADRYKQVLKKMAGTSEQIFLDQTLPLEAIPAEPAAEASPSAGPSQPAPAALDPAVIESFKELVSGLRQAKKSLAPPEVPADLPEKLQKALAGGKLSSPPANLSELCAELDGNMGTIVNSMNSIIEAMSFQDLSGQTIYRIVRLITDSQMQLLAIVVSFGSKLKSKAQTKEITSDQSEKVAQEEVGKVMSSLGAHEEGEEEESSKLDQDAVNNLLESMGF